MFLTIVVQKWLRSEVVSCNDPAFTEVWWIDVVVDMCCMISSYLCVVGHKALKALQRSLLELQDLLLYQNPETRAISQGKTWGASRYQILLLKYFFGWIIPHFINKPNTIITFLWWQLSIVPKILWQIGSMGTNCRLLFLHASYMTLFCCLNCTQ